MEQNNIFLSLSSIERDAPLTNTALDGIVNILWQLFTPCNFSCALQTYSDPHNMPSGIVESIR